MATIKSITLAAFKQIANVTEITIERGETSGKLRGVNAAGERICSVSPDIKLDQDINALHMSNDEGEDWWFLVNDEERVAVGTI